MPVIWLVAVVVSSLVAFVIGLLSLRTSGVYFIMITLAFGQMFFFFSISWSAYGGEDGLSIYVRNGFPGLNTLVPIQFYGLCFGILAVVLLFSSKLQRSTFGLALNAARQTPERVETVGLNPTRLQLLAFILSGAITGLAGALFADLNRFVSPTMFSWQMSGEIIISLFLVASPACTGRLSGLCCLWRWSIFWVIFRDYWHIYLGILLLAVVLFARGGVIGMLLGREVAHD